MLKELKQDLFKVEEKLISSIQSSVQASSIQLSSSQTSPSQLNEEKQIDGSDKLKKEVNITNASGLSSKEVLTRVGDTKMDETSKTEIETQSFKRGVKL